MKVRDWLEFLNQKAPFASAEKWDPVGLLVGDAEQHIRGAEVGIDLSAALMEKARKNKSNLIVNHHPCFFPKQAAQRPMTRQTQPLMYGAARNGISVVAAHTNFDRCGLEVGERIAKGLKFEPRGRLMERGSEPLEKLVAYVPHSHREAVEKAVFQAGAGAIGRYEACGFVARGVGSFRPLGGAKPFLGRVGALERVEESRLEVTLPKWLAEDVVEAMLRAHPYEEVAFDRYALENDALEGRGIVRGIGYGIWGEFRRGITFSDLVSSVKNLFRLGGHFRPEMGRKVVKTVGFVPGKGSAFVECAQRLGSGGLDVLITGEVGYHASREARERGMVILEIGHTESECFFPVVMKNWLREFFEN